MTGAWPAHPGVMAGVAFPAKKSPDVSELLCLPETVFSQQLPHPECAAALLPLQRGASWQAAAAAVGGQRHGGFFAELR